MGQDAGSPPKGWFGGFHLHVLTFFTPPRVRSRERMEGRRPGVRGGPAGRLPSTPRAPGSAGRRLPGEPLSPEPPSAMLGLALLGGGHSQGHPVQPPPCAPKQNPPTPASPRGSLHPQGAPPMHSRPQGAPPVHPHGPTRISLSRVLAPPQAPKEGPIAPPSPGGSPPPQNPAPHPVAPGSHHVRHATPYPARAITGSPTQRACVLWDTPFPERRCCRHLD